MKADLAKLVRQRAGERCEYCRIPAASEIAFEIDHIIARKHRGSTIASNLCAACWHCNSFKGPNLTGRDTLTRKTTKLFHPRLHKWDYHFRYDGAILVGKTAIGRTTIAVLEINSPDRVETREALIEEGLF